MIAIKEELDNKLNKLKKGNQSFSDIIEVLLTETQKIPLLHFGIGKELDPHDLDEFEQILKDNRRFHGMNNYF